ncbi:MAG: response regulator transcription factor, partial [Acidimicrobiales bacterium]
MSSRSETDPSQTAKGQITLVTRIPRRARQILGLIAAAGYSVRVVRAIGEVMGDPVPSSDAVILDVTEADQDVVSALDRYLAQIDVPLMVFTAAPDSGGGIAGLEAGAHDLLTAAMPSEELIARVRAVLRRRTGGQDPNASRTLTSGPVYMDMHRRCVEVGGRAVFLTALEFKLLSYFLMHPDQPMTRERLLEAVWGYSVGGTATVTVTVRRLREKIEEDP